MTADAADPEIVRRVVAAVEQSRIAGQAVAALRGSATLRCRSARRSPAPALGARPSCGRGGRRNRARGRDRRPGAQRCRSRHRPRRARRPRRRRRPDLVLPDVLDGVFRDAADLATRARAAWTALAEHDGPLVRALDDEIDLARRLVIAVLALRHGERIREAVRVVEYGEGARRALGGRGLDVLLSRDEAALALPLVRRDLTVDEATTGLGRSAPPARGAHEWIADITGDPEGVWRSTWPAACAFHTTGPSS